MRAYEIRKFEIKLPVAFAFTNSIDAAIRRLPKLLELVIFASSYIKLKL